jgi:hypothetical protein
VKKNMFKPGQSGNPGGRPKSKALRQLCRLFTEDAVTELARLALNAKGEMTRVVAIRELLDRAYGRPAQALEVALDDQRPDEEIIQPVLTPPEVEAALGVILTKAEKDLGLVHDELLSTDERAQRLLKQPRPIPPYLYKALQRASGTQH